MPQLGLTKIKLMGVLGKKFIREISLDIDSVTEAVCALSMQFPGFAQFLIDSEKEGVAYRVFSIKDKTPQEIYEEDLAMSIAGDSLIISPVYIASGGSPIFRTILGVGLIGAAFLTGGVSLFGLSISGTTMGLMGAALVLGGVSQMLAPNPVRDKKKEEVDNKTLAALNRNTIQGKVVPVAYGDILITEPIPISQSVTNEILVGDSVEALFEPLHHRVTQARLDYIAQPVYNYTYLDHPTTKVPLVLPYIYNNDPDIGCCMLKNHISGSLVFEVRFTTTADGLSMAARYPIQRLIIKSGFSHFVGANRIDIWAGNTKTSQVGLGAFALNNGYTDLNFSGLPEFRHPFHVYTFYFNSAANLPYVAVGELEIYGTIGMTHSINYVLGA
jgi:predicted phage tail protein